MTDYELPADIQHVNKQWKKNTSLVDTKKVFSVECPHSVHYLVWIKSA